MSKLIFVSFADKRFRNSLKRLKECTKSFPFDKSYFLTQETTLSKKYWKELKPGLYRRGYGFWAWKAVIIKEYMQKLNDGDMLFWSDGGIFWNYTPEVLTRFQEYLGMVNIEKPLLTFQQPTMEQEYTKGIKQYYPLVYVTAYRRCLEFIGSLYQQKNKNEGKNRIKQKIKMQK